MQFILTGYDGTDKGAIDRRMKAREEHLEKAGELKQKGNFLWGGALLDNNGTMIGSVIVYEFESRQELDKMLENEPYITGGVWERTEIKNFKLASL
jgi:uncharacterized protein YciI